MPNQTEKELFVAAILASLAQNDWANLGAKAKFHYAKDKKTGDKTDTVTGVFANLTIQVPDETPIMLGGKKYFAGRLQIGINGFNLATQPGESITTGDSPSAASIDLSNLDTLLAKMPSGSRKDREAAGVSVDTLGEFMTNDSEDVTDEPIPADIP